METDYNETLGFYEKLVKTNPEIERKGKKIPYTSLNGNMYSFLLETGELGIRLPNNERVKFLDKYKTGLLEAYGAVMKEYVRVPENLLKKTGELKKYFDISYEYAKTLKPKKTKKK
jgi:hypothetical protein